MKKFRLQLDDLMIDIFSTKPVRREKGTVFGEQCTCPTACTCPGCPTCDASCNGTCAASCNGTCAGTCAGSCDNSCDLSCGGTCYGSCGLDTCDYTCQGFATFGGRFQECVLC